MLGTRHPDGVGYHYLHWCPNGCGKRVKMFGKLTPTKKHIFICSICRKLFLKTNDNLFTPYEVQKKLF